MEAAVGFFHDNFVGFWRMSFYLTLLLSPFYNYAQSFSPEAGAHSASVGNASLCIHNAWDPINNMAGLSQTESFSVGIFAENRFLLKELGLQAFALNIPFQNKSGLGLYAIRFGGTSYSELKFGISYGKHLFQAISVGINLNMYRFSVSELALNQQLVSCELSLSYNATSSLSFCTRVVNPFYYRLGSVMNEQLWRMIQIGMSYSISDEVTTYFQVDKRNDTRVNLKLGIEYNVTPSFRIGAGLNSHPTNSFFGFGLMVSKFVIEISSCWHQQLGIYPQFSITFHSDGFHQKK